MLFAVNNNVKGQRRIILNFYNDFDRNVQFFKKAFDRDDTFVIKQIKNEHSPKLKIAIAVVNCMVSNDVVDRDVIAPLSKMRLSADIEIAEREGICAHSTELQPDAQAALISVASGDCAVIIGNNDRVIIIDTKGMAQRGIDAPESELSISGPAEGFNENIMTNLSLVKRKIMSNNLKNEFMQSGRQSNSKFCVCYIDGVARPELVEKLKKRLEQIDTDYIGDTNYIAEMIRDNKSSFIKTYGKTSRPDVFAAKLMEGRIGIILNGSPTAVTLPYLFIENFQTPDDYYLNCYYANIGRLLRLIGFYVSFLLPALYIAAIIHHQSLLPPEWLYSISASQNGVPIASVLEIVLLFGVFEILRETGARMPSSIGLALNVVGAIILGQSAVDAKLVSAPMVIVVAFSGVMGLMVYDLKGAVFYVRAALIALGACAGIAGVLMGFSAFMLLLYNMSSLGVPIMYVSSPLSEYGRSDTFFRAPIYKMNYRQHRFTDNIKRQGRV